MPHGTENDSVRFLPFKTYIYIYIHRGVNLDTEMYIISLIFFNKLMLWKPIELVNLLPTQSLTYVIFKK